MKLLPKFWSSNRPDAAGAPRRHRRSGLVGLLDRVLARPRPGGGPEALPEDRLGFDADAPHRAAPAAGLPSLFRPGPRRDPAVDGDRTPAQPAADAPTRHRDLVPGATAPPPAVQPGDPDGHWALLRPALLAPPEQRHELALAGRDAAALAAFDVLRTRLLQALRARGWSRVAITSPTRGCGKTFVAANLAASLSRITSCRTVVVDMDLRQPGLAAALGARDHLCLRDYLTGQRAMQTYLRRVGPNLALGLNDAAVADSAELLQEPQTAEALHRMQTALAPDVVLYDLPAALGSDDVAAFLPQVDGVLLVVDGRQTRASEIAECERLFAGQAQLLGVILNRAEDLPDRPAALRRNRR